MKTLKLIGGVVMAGACALVALPPTAHAGPTLDAIEGRGMVVCGVNTGLAGFALPDREGNFKGLDADTCRAIAAAVLGDAKKVKFVPTTA